jgi:hypothetical protein
MRTAKIVLSYLKSEGLYDTLKIPDVGKVMKLFAGSLLSE